MSQGASRSASASGNGSAGLLPYCGNRYMDLRSPIPKTSMPVESEAAPR